MKKEGIFSDFRFKVEVNRELKLLTRIQQLLIKAKALDLAEIE
jgi:hypothetical protein